MTGLADVEALYARIIAAWNGADPDAFADAFVETGGLIGYDGSPSNGRDEIRDVQGIGADGAHLRAVVGVVPNGKTDIEPKVNFLQTMTAVQEGGLWRAVFLQATPAQFHGRPEMNEQLTAELRAAAARG